MLVLCPPVCDEDAALLDIEAIEGFFEGWEPFLSDGRGHTKKIDQDDRHFSCDVVLHQRIPNRWTWQLVEDADGVWRHCYLAEGTVESRESAMRCCLLGLVLMLSDDRPLPAAVERAKVELYAD